MMDDLSQTTAAAEATSAPTSDPEQTGAAATLEGQTLETGADGTQAPVTADGETPPEGTGEKQAGRWKELSTSRDTWKQTAEELLQKVEPIGELLPDATEFVTLTQAVRVGESELEGLDQLIYRLNPPLWDQWVRRAVQMYGPKIGYAPGAPQQQAQYGQPPQAEPAAYMPEALRTEIETVRAYDPETAALMEQQFAAAQQVPELLKRLQGIEQGQEALKEQQVVQAHDSQFAEFTGSLFEKLQVPKFIDQGGQKVLNPQFLSFVDFLGAQLEADPDANAALKASRDAYKNGQVAARPALNGTVKAHIARVFNRAITPLIQQPAPVVPKEVLDRQAAAVPPPSPGGAPAPAPGQNGKVPIRERAAQAYRNAQQR